MTDGTALREIAAEILTEILEKGQYTHLALFQALSTPLSPLWPYCC